MALLSLLTEMFPHVMHVDYLDPLFAAVLGGLLLGTGCLFLARHKSSLGGATIVALYLQNRHGIRAGKVQMAIDCTVLALALSVVPPERVGYSVLAAVVMSVFLWISHRPGRYVGSRARQGMAVRVRPAPGPDGSTRGYGCRCCRSRPRDGIRRHAHALADDLHRADGGVGCQPDGARGDADGRGGHAHHGAAGEHGQCRGQGQPQQGSRPVGASQEHGRPGQRTRMPGVAPGHGFSTWMPGCAFSSPWLAASTMPSETPNFILRGARLATITVSLPTSSSGR